MRNDEDEDKGKMMISDFFVGRKKRRERKRKEPENVKREVRIILSSNPLLKDKREKKTAKGNPKSTHTFKYT